MFRYFRYWLHNCSIFFISQTQSFFSVNNINTLVHCCCKSCNSKLKKKLSDVACTVVCLRNFSYLAIWDLLGIGLCAKKSKGGAKSCRSFVMMLKNRITKANYCVMIQLSSQMAKYNYAGIIDTGVFVYRVFYSA